MLRDTPTITLPEVGGEIAPTTTLPPLPELSSREREIATMLAQGYTNREIANVAVISVKTVDTHRGHILKKLNLRNNVDLAREALRQGLVTL